MEQPIDSSLGSILGGTTRSILFGYFLARSKRRTC